MRFNKEAILIQRMKHSTFFFSYILYIQQGVVVIQYFRKLDSSSVATDYVRGTATPIQIQVIIS